LDELEHPCIIRLRECGFTIHATKERPYLLLNYFDGVALEQHVREQGPLPVADARAVARLIAEGLKAAHERGILHRDVKPANVLARQNGGTWQVKLIDFGLAVKQQALQHTLTHTARVSKTVLGQRLAGTLDYAAPEQLGRRPESVAPYSDVYAFGRTICYTLFGTPNPGLRHWKTLDDDRFVTLLSACVEENPKDRPM